MFESILPEEMWRQLLRPSSFNQFRLHYQQIKRIEDLGQSIHQSRSKNGAHKFEAFLRFLYAGKDVSIVDWLTQVQSLQCTELATEIDVMVLEKIIDQTDALHTYTINLMSQSIQTGLADKLAAILKVTNRRVEFEIDARHQLKPGQLEELLKLTQKFFLVLDRADDSSQSSELLKSPFRFRGIKISSKSSEARLRDYLGFAKNKALSITLTNIEDEATLSRALRACKNFDDVEIWMQGYQLSKPARQEA